MDLLTMVAALTLGVIAVFTPIPGNVLASATWFVKSWTFTVLCKDTKKAKGPPKALTRARNRKVRVVFVRHGESVWNCVVNRFGIYWPFRAVKYAFETALLVIGNRNDSVIIDSPLSPLGEKQANALAAYTNSAEGRAAIPIDPKTSVIVSSNLRRAMGTAVLGLCGRLAANPGEKIVIDSSLQEGSRNADAQSFMTPKGRLVDSPVLQYENAAALGAVFDPALSLGNKSRSSNVNDRIDAFAARIFGEGPNGLATLVPVANPTSVVAVGHSLWIKKFFARYLPASSNHVAKNKKLKNCAVVSFDLCVDANGVVTIDEASITPLYLGFNK